MGSGDWVINQCNFGGDDCCYMDLIKFSFIILLLYFVLLVFNLLLTTQRCNWQDRKLYKLI